MVVVERIKKYELNKPPNGSEPHFKHLKISTYSYGTKAKTWFYLNKKK